MDWGGGLDQDRYTWSGGLGRISLALYVAAIPLAFVHQLISDAIYLFVALMWLVPDRRIERNV